MLNYLDKPIFKKLDSITKYPSILTYHAMLDAKRLKEEVQVDFSQCEHLYATEKADGQNMRVVTVPQFGTFLGTRDELVCMFDPLRDPIGEPRHKNDPIHEFKKLIVNNHVARTKFHDSVYTVPCLTVWYFEMFGGRIGPHKHYTSNNDIDWRVLDQCQIEDHESLMAKPPEWLSGWRNHGGQKFLNIRDFHDAADSFNLEPIRNHVHIINGDVSRLATLVGAYYVLQDIAGGRSAFTMDLDASGVIEGIVLRNFDRTKIAKLRFEDYERSLGLR